jgi:hypothetical protein
MSFIIERGSIQKARGLLSHAGLVQCTSNTCWSRTPTAEDNFTFSNGAVHFHLAPNMLPSVRPSVQLHIRDERIWTLPEEDSPTYTDSKNIIFASDERLPTPNWGLPVDDRGVRGRCRHYPGSPVRILTPECYVDALVLLMVRDRNTNAALNWSTQINYMLQYRLFDPEKVHPASKRYMTIPPEISEIDNLEKATATLGDIAEQEKLHAEWAK